MNKEKHFTKYIEIRNEITSQCDDLHVEHFSNTQCRKGCSECCMNFSILPVEFFSIMSSLHNDPPKLNTSNPDKCLFLVDDVCQIYAHRPSICRSHGLPILNMDEAGENMELSFCPLNFKDVEVDYFTMENGFQQDKYNSKLYMVNQEFLKSSNDQKFDQSSLIEIRKMAEYFQGH